MSKISIEKPNFTLVFSFKASLVLCLTRKMNGAYQHITVISTDWTNYSKKQVSTTIQASITILDLLFWIFYMPLNIHTIMKNSND